MKKSFPQKSIGVLGGGQLARMLVLKGHELGIKMHILSESENDPAAQVTQHWQKGSPNAKEDLEKFLKNVDVATFESEFIDAKLLHQVCRENQYQVYPKPLLMAKLQDRLTQKQLLQKHQVPTSEFLIWKENLSWKELHDFNKTGVVIKKRLFGYDGYGTFIVTNQKEFNDFKDNFSQNDAGFIVEPLIKFKREMSIICARNKKGQFIHFPLAESYQKDARCFWVKGPVKHSQEKNLIRIYQRFLNAINYVGVMGIELFDSGRAVLVNEIAPRVHNTGHHSLDSLNCDQFTYHLLCLIGSDLPQPVLVAPGFAMVNLLGENAKSPSWKMPTQAQIYWYGKNQNRPGRKMGHINSVAKTPKEALNHALRALKEFSL